MCFTIFYLFSVFLLLYCTAQQNYFIDARQNYNNVYGALKNPDQGNEWIRYLGKFSSTNECINACLKNSTTNNRCESYTYYTSALSSSYASHCFGRFGSPYGILWQPVSQKDVNCGRIIYPCTSNLDCSLNGKCDKISGNCTCDTAWDGYHCQQLNLLPATKGNGYHIINDNNSGKPTSSWGGAILIDNSNTAQNDTKYHMYLAEFDNHCGVNSWTINSRVSHAQSTKGYDSPYQRVQVIHEHFAHEPDAVNGPNGEIVLYYVAYNHSGIAECECSDGSTVPDCKGINCKGKDGACFINIMQYAEANNFNGPWYRTVIFPERSPSFPDTNLAGVILNNGSFVGFLRLWTTGSEIHLVTSNNWKNGSDYIQHSQILFPQLVPALAEDPFLWLDCNGGYHAIFHNMSPDDLQTLCGGHAYSADGVNWIYGGSAFGNTVQFTDNTDFTFSRRERPHLVFGDDKCTPIALTNGAQYGGQYGDATYTLLQPVKSSN
eukprot:460311_1